MGIDQAWFMLPTKGRSDRKLNVTYREPQDDAEEQQHEDGCENGFESFHQEFAAFCVCQDGQHKGCHEHRNGSQDHSWLQVLRAWEAPLLNGSADGLLQSVPFHHIDL